MFINISSYVFIANALFLLLSLSFIQNANNDNNKIIIIQYKLKKLHSLSLFRSFEYSKQNDLEEIRIK